MKKNRLNCGLNMALASIMTLSATAPAMAADTRGISAAVSNDSFGLMYENAVYQTENGSLILNPNVLFAENSTKAMNPGILWRMQPANMVATHVELGIKAFFIDGDRAKSNAYAVGLGGKFAVPAAPEIFVAGDFYYSPTATTFRDDSKHVSSWNARVGYDFNESTELFLGYRDLKVEYSNKSNETVESGVFGGFTFRF